MKAFQGKIYISNGRISDLIEDDSMLQIIFLDDDSRTMELGNSYAIPGLVDSHGHIAALGKQINGLTLNDCKSAEECAERALHHDIFRGGWITGNGWNQELWDISDYPHRKILDDVLPDVPVYLMRVDGHTCWVNSKALKIAGIDKYTPDPKGGKIEKDKSGHPTGILIDNALELVRHLIPHYSIHQTKSFIIESMTALASVGITQVHDMDVPPEYLKIYNELAKNNKLSIKIHSYIAAQNDEYINAGISPYSINDFHVSGIKFYADGALGSHGAALIKPYSDKKETKGLLLIDENTLFEKAKRGLEKGFNIATHSIGDAANRLVLSTYKKLYDSSVAENNNVLRVEHAQIVHPDDLHIFEDYEIYAAVQPIQCISDRFMAPKRLGNRIEYAYPWRTLIENGARIMGGSDFPIESHNPMLGLDALIRRTHPADQIPWIEKEILSCEQAFLAYIQTPKQLVGEYSQDIKLTKKMAANICILPNDPYKNPSSIKAQKPIAVFCNGMQTYPKK